jgi:opacity protein-like surface antigen
MKSFKFLVSTILFVSIAFIQSYSQSSFNIHLGPSIPLSDYSSENIDNDDAGGAGIGIDLGLQYTYQLTESGLGLFAGIDFNYNGLKKDVKDDIEQMFEDYGITSGDFTHYKYFNIPISAGLIYKYDADDKISLIGNAGLTINFLKVSDFILEVNGDRFTTEFDLSNSVGFKIGGGILINSRTSIMIDYLALGRHDLNGKMSASGVPSEDIDGEQKIDMLTITVGLRF